VRTGGFSGLIPTVVPEPVLPRAYGAEAVSYNIAGIAGPALAGAVAGTFGASWSIGATAVVALVSFVVVAKVPIETVTAGLGQPLRASLRAGMSLLWRQRPLRSVTVATTVGQGWFGLMVVAFPLLAHDLGHARAAGGLLFSVFAVGALVGSMLYTRIAGRWAEEPLAMVAFVLFAVALAGIAVAPNLVLAVAAAGASGLFDGPLLAATLNLRQRLSPEALRTQVFTTAASMKIGAFAIGSALAGPAADAVGARGMLGLVAGGQIVAVLAGLAVRRL
jgi:MFS family permease